MSVTVTLNRIWYSGDYSLMIEMKTAYILLGSFEMLFSLSTAADFFLFGSEIAYAYLILAGVMT